MLASWFLFGTPCNVTVSHGSVRPAVFLRDVLTYLAGEVCGTTLGGLQDDWGFCVPCGLKGSDDGGRRGDVDSGNSELLLLGVLEEVLDVLSVDDTGLLENCWGHFVVCVLISGDGAGVGEGYRDYRRVNGID